MNGQRHATIKAIFLAACELADDERGGYLARACGDDADLRREVESLLGFHSPETLLGGLSETGVSNVRRGPVSPGTRWVGRQLGKYQVVRVIDSGGMGAVLEGYDPSIDRGVAIKLLRDELAHDEPMRRRFLAEARAAGGLNHPHVITIHDAGQEGDTYYLVMEFAEGGSTAEQMKRLGPYPPEEATRLLQEACQGVAAAHARGLVHRDIKPANLLLTRGGVVKVTDFGIAKLSTPESLALTAEGQVVGTPNFMSPEQCAGGEIDVRTDVYSMGATYYSLLTGRMPYDTCDSLVSLIHAHCHLPPPDPREVDPTIPPVCAKIIHRAMAKSPADRFPSMDDLLKALLGDAAPPPRSSVLSIPNTVQPVTRRRLLRTATAATILAAGGAWGAWHWRQRKPPLPAGGITPPSSTPRPIRIGILHSLSGTMARSEEAIVDGYSFAIEEINRDGGVLGRPIEPVVADGQSMDDTFAAEAGKLIDQQDICTLFGCCTSSSRKAVVPVVEEKRHLLVYCINHEGVETSPHVVYAGGDPSQTILPCVPWAYAFQQVRSFFLVGSDYVFPRIANEMLKDQVELTGAQVAGERYLSLGTTDVDEVVDEIATAQPDAIINTISGDTQIAFVRRLRDRGVKAAQFATGIGEQEVRNIRIDRLVGDYTIGTYFQSIQSAMNVDFVARFRKRYGARRVVSAPMESAYAAINLWAAGVESAATLDPLVIRDAMLQQQFPAPSGMIRFDAASQYAMRRSYIGQIEPSGQFRVAWHSVDPIPPTPYPPTRTRAEWERLLVDLHQKWDGQWSAPQQ